MIRSYLTIASRRRKIITNWMSSWESIDGTNSLFIKRPVGTLIVLLRPGMGTGQDMDELEDPLTAFSFM